LSGGAVDGFPHSASIASATNASARTPASFDGSARIASW
jgi:hypothetical protein